MNLEEAVEADELTPPTRITSDYIEIGYLLVLGVAGAVVNLIAFTDLNERRSTARPDRLLALKRHMNYTDMMVIFFYTTSRVCWLAIYTWKGGDALCRLVKFGQALSFQSSSNVVVVIAVDRVLSVLSPLRGCRTATIFRVHCLLIVAWILAVALSLPQLFVWKAFEPFPNWPQCTDIWEIARWQSSFENEGNSTVYHMFPAERIYNIYHIVMIFWLPLGIITICYATVIFWLWKRRAAIRSPGSTSTNGKNGTPPIIVSGNSRLSLLYVRTNLGWNGRSANEYYGTLGLGGAQSPSCSSVRFTLIPEKTRDSLNNNLAASQPIRIKSISSTRRNAVRVSCALVIAYVLCWLPYNSLVLWKLIDPIGYSARIENSMYFINGLIVANSVVNPFLYGTFGKRIDHLRVRGAKCNYEFG